MFRENNVRKGNVELRNCEHYLYVTGFRKYFQNLRNLGDERTMKLRYLPI
jgi:hypothetical protein